MIRMKKTIIIVLSLLMLFSLPLNANAASKKKAALKAYKRILTTKAPWYSGKKVKVWRFALIYLDNDSAPELCVEGEYSETMYAEGCKKIFTYYKGKVRTLQLTNDTCKYYYKKTGFFASDWAKQGGVRLSYDYYPGKGKKVKGICYKSYWVGDEANAKYYVGDSFQDEITQKEYYRLIKKYSKGKKATKVKWYENTAKNRKKYLK